MSTPPLLLGVTLLFWGWQTGTFWLGVLAALSIESCRLTKARWDFPQSDLNRIFNLCTAMFLGSWVIAFATSDAANALGGLMKSGSFAARAESLNKSVRAVLKVFQWLPLSFLPIVLAQVYGQRERMDLATFSMWLRRRRARGEIASADSGLNVSWPYFALCLLAACSANERTLWFTAGLILLSAWALWTSRQRGFSATRWAIVLLAAVSLGFVLQMGLRGLQQLVQRLDNAIIAGMVSNTGFDAKESRTMIGAVGKVKQSGSILLRLETDGQSPPGLLREAVYNRYKEPMWIAANRNFTSVVPEADGFTWNLLNVTNAARAVTIAGYLPGGKGLLALPFGTTRLEELGVFILETNVLAAVFSAAGPGFVRFRAAYDAGSSLDGVPEKDDLEVPDQERATMSRVADELNLHQLSPEERLAALRKFFASHFRYSTWLDERHRSRSRDTALARFLQQHRTGHCEYFAAATTLLLRQAGIPARYVVGYSVQEKRRKQWVVRGRHAHAWCLAYVNGAWRDIDNTPAEWSAIEDARAPWWEAMTDAWSRVWFEFSKWRWGGSEWRRYLLWLVVPLLLLAAGRIVFQKQWRRTGNPAASPARPRLWPGLDSEFYAIERELEKRGLERRAGETFSAWLARLERDGGVSTTGLHPLLQLHYRLRFDPEGLGRDDRAVLESSVAAWRDKSVSMQGK
jgi:protein-glutamine gamma-glutamyltransferase